MADDQTTSIQSDEEIENIAPDADNDESSISVEDEEQKAAQDEGVGAPEEAAETDDAGVPVTDDVGTPADSAYDEGEFWHSTSSDRLPSSYSLVSLAAKRAKQLREGARPLVPATSRNLLTVALEEIRQGKITFRLQREEEKETPDD